MNARATDEQAVDFDTVSKAVKIVAKGSILVFASVFLEHVFTFARRMIIVRSLTESEYGIYSLGLSIVMFAMVLAGIGLDVGLQRFIGIYRGRGDMEGVKGIVYTDILISVFTVTFTMVLLMATSSTISSLLDKQSLSTVLFYMAFLVPLMSAISLIVNVYRGFENVTPKAVFECIGSGLVSLIMVTMAVVFFDTLYSVVIALILGYAITLTALVAYVLVRPPRLPRGIKPRYEFRKLILFSLPLVISGFATQMIIRTDTIMLGYFAPAAKVGIYNAAVPLYQILAIFLVAVVFIYSPVASRMIGEGRHGELRSLYPSVTKWLFIFTLPAWLIFLFYPSEALRLFFGSRYVGAAGVLQILVISEFFHTIAGPNGMTLIAYGKTTLAMVDVICSAILNVVLNLLLIPKYGITGAAVATATSVLLRNVLYSGQIFHYYRIHPFTRDYLKSILGSLFFLGLLYYPVKALLNLTVWILPLLYPVFLAISLAVVLLTGSIDRTDLVLYRAVKQRLLMSVPKRFLPGNRRSPRGE